MKNVLIVDDEKNFLLSLTDGLSNKKYGFNVLTAQNGKEALNVLSTTQVSMVVTDLKMPVMDGFDLIANMSRAHRNVPVMVMTAFGGPKVSEKLSSMAVEGYIEKPIDYKDLAKRIHDELASDSSGYIHGITLPAFLQLIEMEKKTCTLKISSGNKTGCLYINKGELMEAETGLVTGDSAAYDILCWEEAEIAIDPVCGKKSKNVSLPLNHLMMEAFRLKDENERREEDIPEAEWGEDISLELVEPVDEQQNETPIAKEVVMALEKHLQALKEIKGYKAAGIMNFTGEMLVYDSVDPNVDLGLVGATFNDIFRSAHEASKKIGLDACKETVITTPKGIIVMRCSGVDSKAHFHVIAIMSHDGNQALMKMQMEKMVPVVMAEAA
jgi:CheY-like chemotaxis protein